MTRPCPCCDTAQFERLLDFGHVPVSGVFRTGPTEALISAPLAFELCGACGLVRQEGSAAPRDYTGADRATARQFPAYGGELVAKLKSLGVGRDELVIEIGSNDGSFLERLRGGGFRCVVGVEPSRRLAEEARARGFVVVNDYFGPGFVARLLETHGRARAAVCRHTLEHVPDPLAFVEALRDCLDPKTGVGLMEVPDGTVIPDRMHVDEFWDEHLYYFCASNLARLVERAGMNILEIEVRPHLDTLNLLVWCGVASTGKVLGRAGAERDGVALWRGLAPAWEAYRRRLAEALGRAPCPLYLIGASHRQYNFANYARIGALVEYFIDDDPAKIGRFPPVAVGRPSIISTVQFEVSARAGTVLKTAFGYPKWTARVCEHAARHGMRVLDPRELVERRH